MLRKEKLVFRFWATNGLKILDQLCCNGSLKKWYQDSWVRGSDRQEWVHYPPPDYQNECDDGLLECSVLRSQVLSQRRSGWRHLQCVSVLRVPWQKMACWALSKSDLLVWGCAQIGPQGKDYSSLVDTLPETNNVGAASTLSGKTWQTSSASL